MDFLVIIVLLAILGKIIGSSNPQAVRIGLLPTLPSILRQNEPVGSGLVVKVKRE